MDGISVSNNPYLNDPIGSALIGMGVIPADISLITDADVMLAGDRIQELLDRAELRLLKNIAGNLDLVDIAIGPRKESLSQLHEQVIKEIDTLSAQIAKEYGIGTGTLGTGTIALDFQESF